MSKTVLLVDIENGSVASALATIPRALGDAPKLFAEKRIHLPVFSLPTNEQLLFAIEDNLDDALAHTSQIAAHLRTQETTAGIGTLTRAVVFVSAPWTSLVKGDTRLEWVLDQELLEMVRRKLQHRIAPHLIEYHPIGRSLARGLEAIAHEPVLILHATGEVSELLVAQEGKVLGRATLPIGIHTVLRTLQSHGGLTFHEAHSALKLAKHPTAGKLYTEPLSAAGDHYASAFLDIAREVITDTGASKIFVVSSHIGADFIARAISQEGSSLFPHGGSVRALQSHHFEPYIATHPTNKDVQLMLETLFIHKGTQTPH